MMCKDVRSNVNEFGVKMQQEKMISCTALRTHRGSSDWCDHRQTDVLQRHATASADGKSDSSRT